MSVFHSFMTCSLRSIKKSVIKPIFIHTIFLAPQDQKRLATMLASSLRKKYQ